ncbi:MAG: hypothetical protein HZC42_02775 [Candidatus Eisenbacteria bacterium]|nr:hypothetical protein [Candidatus Eisenbacteria bacterium]
MIARERVSRIIAVFALTVLVAGCGRRDVLPTDVGGDRAPGTAALRGEAAATSGHHGFYPLEIGNRWHYARVFTVWIRGGAPAGPPDAVLIRSTRSAELTGVESLFDRDYVIERDAVIEESRTDTFVTRLAYRQDRSGLYEADLPLAEQPLAARPPAEDHAWQRLAASLADPASREAYRAAWERLQVRLDAVRAVLEGGAGEAARRGPRGGPLDHEITRLRYPLRPGARWVIRDDPRFESFVERPDLLNLPAGRFGAWRVRIASVLFGPQDIVRTWYGRAGYLRLEAHLESEARDQNGQPIGTLVSEQTEALDDLQLVGRDRIAMEPLPIGRAPTAGAGAARR